MKRLTFGAINVVLIVFYQSLPEMTRFLGRTSTKMWPGLQSKATIEIHPLDLVFFRFAIAPPSSFSTLFLQFLSKNDLKCIRMCSSALGFFMHFSLMMSSYCELYSQFSFFALYNFLKLTKGALFISS